MPVLLVCLQFCAAAVIGFVQTTVTVGEASGPAILNMALLFGSLERDVFVDLSTQDGTAMSKSEMHVSSAYVTGSFTFSN